MQCRIGKRLNAMEARDHNGGRSTVKGRGRVGRGREGLVCGDRTLYEGSYLNFTKSHSTNEVQLKMRLAFSMLLPIYCGAKSPKDARDMLH